MDVDTGMGSQVEDENVGGQRSTLEMVLGKDAVQSPTMDHPS